MKHVNGSERTQIKLQCLEDLVGADSAVRQIDEVVNRMDTSYFEKSKLKDVGRPPYDPKDMLKLYLYGMDNGIISSRKLERECKRNIELMWLINELTPENKTICNFRRENAENIVRFYNEFVRALKDMGYIDGKVVAVDGTKIRANNSRRNNFSLKKINRQIDYIDKKLSEYINELDKNDKIEELKERKEKYLGYKQRIADGEVSEVSVTDSDSRMMKASNGGADVSYNVQAVVDSKHKLVAGVLVTNEPNDQGQLHKAAKGVKDNLDLETMTALGDKGYHATEDFKKCHEDGITTIVSKPDKKDSGDGLFKKEDFIYDNDTDSYTCPAGQVLSFSTQDKWYRRYRNVKACKKCAMKPLCTKGNRKDICRHEHEEYADKNDKDFDENTALYRTRQELSEHPFGTIKRTMGIRQFLLRGLIKVNAEAALIFLAYNLKRLRNLDNGDNKKDDRLIQSACVILCLYVFDILRSIDYKIACRKINFSAV